MPVDAALIQVAPAGRERDVQPRHLGQRDVRGGVRRQARERPCQSRDAQNAATAASRSIGIRPARSGRPAAGHEPADGIADQIVAYVSPPPSTWASSARGSSCVGAPVTRSPRSATCACATAARSASGRRRLQRLSQSRRPDSNRGSLHYEIEPEGRLPPNQRGLVQSGAVESGWKCQVGDPSRDMVEYPYHCRHDGPA
jgi:hypothetical protein